MKAIEFPVGVRRSQPFDSAAAGVLWWRQAVDGDYGDQVQVEADRWSYTYMDNPATGRTGRAPITLAPVYADLRDLVTVTAADLEGRDGPQDTWTEEFGDLRGLSLGFARAIPGVNWSDPRVPVPAELEAAAAMGVGTPVTALGLYRVLAGQEWAYRQQFDLTDRKERPKSAKVLAEYESAVVTADLVLTTVLNRSVSGLWMQLLNTGADVYPSPTPGADRAGTSPTGTVRLGLTP